MDEDFLFINSFFKSLPNNTHFKNEPSSAKNTKSLSSVGTHKYGSDDVCHSQDKMNDALNLAMSPDDFMFSETQECSMNQDAFCEQDFSGSSFSPARYFDLFGETENDDFQFTGSLNHVDQLSRKASKRVECKKADEIQNKMTLNGVLNHRSLYPSISRMKQVGTVTSCSNIIRQSATMPSTRLAVSRMKVHNNASPDSGIHSSSDNSNMSSDLKHSTKGRYSPLEDHRYYARVRRSESPPPSKKRNFNMNSGMHPSKSCPYSDRDKPSPAQPKMSILEAFLRATCPLDPNKGSDAALATKGMLNLCIREPKAFKKKQTASNNGSNILLKKLLVDEENHIKIEPEDFSEFVSLDSSADNFLVDSILIDGFGLDVGLSIDEEGIFNMPDCTSDWQEDFLQMDSSIEHEESVKLQDHQDALCLQHYAGTFL